MRGVRIQIISLLLALLVCMTAVLCGCSQKVAKEQANTEEARKSDAKTQKKLPVIRFAHAYTGADLFSKRYNELLMDFQEKNKDKLILQIEPDQWDDIKTTIRTYMAANNLPEVFQTGSMGYYADFIKGNFIISMEELFNRSKILNRDSFPAEAWAGMSVDGGKSVYGLPLEGATMGLMANRTIFKKYSLKYPKNYAELKEVGKVFKMNGVIPMAIGSKGGNLGHWILSQILYQYTGSDYTSGILTGESKFHCEPILKASELVIDMAKNDLFPEDTITNSEYTQTITLYNERKAAMALTFPWTNGSIKPDIVEETDMIHMPKFPGAVNDPSKFTLGGANVGMAIARKGWEDPTKTNAITSFVEFLFSDEMLTEWAKNGRWVCKPLKLDLSQVPPMYGKVFEFSKDLKLKTNLWALMPSNNTQVVLSNGTDAIMAQSISAKDFVKDVQKAIDEVYNVK